MSKNARSRMWSRWLSRKPAAELPARSLGMETLEDRLAPATFTWDGGGANSLWTTAANWENDAGPAQAAPGTLLDLVFPASAARPANQNDLATNTVINSITIQGQPTIAGVPTPYNITQAPDPAVNSIVLGTGSPSSGNFSVQPNSGRVIFGLPTTLATNGDQSINVGGSGSELRFTAAITGSALNNLNKDGVGRLALTTANPNLVGGVKVNQGILEIGNVQSLGPTGSPETVVGTNAALYLSNVATVAGQTTIGEQVRLNGGGIGNIGALFLEAGGPTVWSGQVILETGITSPPQAGGPGTVIGAGRDASTGTLTTLNITGVISDSAAGMGLVKEGPGELRLGSTTGNTYRGQTNVSDGTLTVTHSLSLGDSRQSNPGAFQNPTAGTVVNVGAGRNGQLRLEAPVGGPAVRVIGEYLVLNGAGNDGFGSLFNNRGDNTWAGSVVLGSGAPDGADVSIGVAPATVGPVVPSSLTISGVVSDPFRPGAVLTKVQGGRLILTNANTYTGRTDVSAGSIAIRDSQGLGPAGSSFTEVFTGAAVELDVEAAYPQATLPRFDDLGRDTWADSITNNAQKLAVREAITLSGRGIGALGGGTGTTFQQGSGGTGAIRNWTGTNTWAATITLSPNAGEASIGVELDGTRASMSGTTARIGHPLPDSSYFRDDYSLTIQDPATAGPIGIVGIRNTDFVKLGQGHLILPQANPYFGRTLIEEGWVTIQNNRSLGDSTPNTSLGETSQQPTVVKAGASLHIAPTAPGVQLTIQEENLVLEGLGIGSLVGQEQHPYSFINQKGALVNLGGDNTVAGDVGLVSTGFGVLTGPNQERGAGIGVESAATVESPVGSGNYVLLPSKLTITGDLSDGITYQRSFGGTSEHTTPAGQLNGAGTRVYDVGVTRGRITVPYNFSSTADRLQIYYPDAAVPANLIYDSGDVFLGGATATTGPGLASVNFGNATSTATTIRVVVSLGAPTSQWQVGTTFIDGTTPFGVLPDGSRYARGVTTQFPSSFVKLGSETLVLQGSGSQSGKKNEVREGTLLAQNDTAFGRATTGTEITQQAYDVTETVVASGATLQLAGSVALQQGGIAAGLHVQDEQLTLNQYGVQVRIAGQPTARFKLDYGGFQTDLLQVPSGYTGAPGTYAAYLQNQINTKLTNIAGDLTAGVPGATPADAAATVTELVPGVYSITFGAARFNRFDFSAFTAIPEPINLPTITTLAEVRISGSNAPLNALSDDNTWRGPVTLNSGTRIDVSLNSRLSLLGDIFEGAPALAPGSDLVKLGIGDLTLGGAASSYRGVTYIDEGIVTAVSSRAFGAASTGAYDPNLAAAPGGTRVKENAQLQVQGSLTIAGEGLAVAGDGTPTLPTIDSTIRWLSVGPGATNNGVSAPFNGVGAPTSARVDSIATDPTDPRVIYVATAGGGAWKTKDGGLTWIALFDQAVDPSNTVLPLSADTTLATVAAPLPRSAMMFGGSIAVAPSNPQVVYYATGDSNGVFNGIPNTNVNAVDNYAGTGVYKSVDSGKTWVRLLSNNGTNPLYGQAVTKLIVDPFFENRIYVSSGVTGASLLATNLNNANQNAVAGVWRWTGAGVGNEGWVNLTAVSGAGRALAGQAPFDAAGGGGPANAGPDDDFRLRFPTGQAGSAEAATWSDIALTIRFLDPANPANNRYQLFAALGESAVSGIVNGTATRAQAVRTGVYFTEDPTRVGVAAAGTGVTWWHGSGTLYPNATDSTADVQTPDKRPSNGYPLAALTTNQQRNGYIKLAAMTTANGSLEGGSRPTTPAFVRTVYPTTVVYASVAKPEGDPGGEVGEFLEIRRSLGTGSLIAGWDWGSAPISDAFLASAFGEAVPGFRPALGRYNHTLAVNDPDLRRLDDGNRDEVILGGLDNIFRATQAAQATGTTWNAIGADDRGFLPGDQFHALHYDGAGRLLTGSDAGLWRWDRLRFSNLNSNLPTVQLNSADPHPTDFRQAVAGASDTGTQVWNGYNTPNGTGGLLGPTWARVDDLSTTVTSAGSAPNPTTGSVAGVVRYDPFNPLTIFAVRDGRLRRSSDGGVTWVQLSPLGGTAGFTGGDSNSFPTASSSGYDLFPLVMDSVTQNRLVIGGRTTVGTRLMESTDGGNSWTDLFTGRLDAVAPGGVFVPRVIALAGYQGAFVADPNFPTVTEGLSNTPDPRTIYVSDGTNLAITKNRGTSYVLLGFPLPGGGTITDIVVNPVNRDEVYVTVSLTPGATGGRIWRSTDAGRSWTNLTGTFDPDAIFGNDAGPLPNIPTWKAAIDPRTGTLYVGNDNGVWVLVDANATDPGNVARTAVTGVGSVLHWRRVGDGMPNVQVRDLVINQTTSTLTAGTHGRGMFQMFLPNYAAQSGAVRAVSGQSRWTGPVVLTGNTTIGAVGTQQIQNGLSAASIDFGGTISDASPPYVPPAVAPPYTITKIGRGTVILSGANTYTGQTVVEEGVLEVKDPNALGSPVGNTVVRYGAALQVRSDIELEPITINGDGIAFNGHYTGALRNISGNNSYNGPLTLGTESTTGAPEPDERDLRQVTIGADSGSSLRIGQNPAGANPAAVGHVQGVTDRILTVTFAGGAPAGFNWAQTTAAGSLAGALTAVTMQQGVLAGARPAVPEVQQFAIPLNAGMVTFTRPNPGGGSVGPFDPNSPTFLADVQTAFRTLYGLPTLTVEEARVGIDKELPGTLILASDNVNYLGLTQVYTGAVEVRAAEALGPVAGSAPTRVSDGAAVRIANVAPNTPTVVTAESLFLSGTGTPDGPGGVGTGALRNTGGNNTWNGPIQLTDIPNFAPTTNPGHQVAFGVNSAADVLSVGPTAGVTEDFATYGQFGLIKVGPGVLTLTTANQYTGVTNVNEGTVRAANNGALGANPPDFVPTAAKPVSPSSEVQTIRVFGTGGYTLTVNGSPTGGLTSNPAGVSSTAAQVQAAIEAVIAGNPATDGATVFVSSTPNSNGNVYTVTFRGRYSGQNVPQLGVIGVASGVTVTIATQQEGGLGTVVASGASLELEGNGLKVSEALTINGPGVTDPNGIRYGALGNRGGDNTYEGTVTLGSATSMGAQPGSDLVVTGRVLGRPIDPTATPNPTTPAAAELTKVGYGTVRFEDDPLTAAVTGDKEYRGRTVIAEGALVITTAGGLGVGRNEVQRLRVTGALGAEKFTLTLLGETTDTILLQAGAAGANAIKTALTSPRSGGNPAMLTAADVDVVVDPDNATIPVGGGVGEAVFLVTFKGRLANTNVPLLTDISPSTPQSTPTLLVVDTTTQGLPPSPTGANEVQTVEIPRQGGTFTLAGVSGVNGNPATFDFDVTLAALQAAFDNANAPFGGPVGARNTSLTQTILPGNTGRLITITYQNASGNQNVSQITGTFTPSLLVRIQGVEDGVGSETQLIDVRNPVGLQYTLTYTNPLTGQVVNGTRLIGATATAATFQAALTDAIGAGGLGIGAGNVLVTRTASAGGFQYLVQFQGSLANVNVLPISATIVNGGANIVVTPVAGGYEGQDGFEGTVVNAGASLQVRNLPAISSEWVTLNGQGRSEAQAFTYTRTAAAGGTFTLQYTGTDGVVVTGTRLLTLGSADGTVPSSTAAEFAAALTDPVGAGGLGLPAGSVFVTRTDVLNGVRFEVQFTGALASVNVPQVVSTVPANGTRLDETLETGGGGALRMLDSTGNFTTVWGNPANVSPLILGSNASIGVESDTDVLRLVLPTTDRNPYSPPTAVLGPTNVRGPNQGFALTKVGAGTLEFNAAGDNDYTGATLVNDGTLLLNHTGAGSHDAVRGPLVVGDGLNPAGTATATPESQTAVVRLAASNQIADAPTVTVNADGLLDLHGWVETIGNLTINNGVVDTQTPTVPAFPAVPAGVSVVGPELTTGTITMTGGRLTVENGDDLLAGTVAAPAAVVMNDGRIEVGTNGAATALVGTITASNTAEVVVADGATLTSAAIDLTASTLELRTAATVLTRGASVTGRQGSTIITGTDSLLDLRTAGGAPRGPLTLTDSTLRPANAAVSGVDLLTGAVSLTNSKLDLGNGPNATLNTGGATIDVINSRLVTGSGAPTVSAGNLTATGQTTIDAPVPYEVDFGPGTVANVGTLTVTNADLAARAGASVSTTGAATFTDATADFFADAALTTAAGGLTLTRSTLTGTSGVDVSTQAVQLLDNSTLSLGTGTAALPATLNTNGNAITVNASTLRTGATPDQTTPATIETGGGALTATGTVARRSVVDLGAGTTSNVGPVSLTLTDLTTGAGARLNAGTVTAADSTLVTGSSSFTNTGTVSLTDSDLSFGAGSTNAVTGNLTTFDTPATANDSNVTFGTGSTTTVTGAASATNAALVLQANAAVTAGTLALSESLADLGTGATLSVSGPVSVAATANGSATSGAGTLRLTGAAAQTVTVLDGAANEDFTIGSGLTATNGQTVVKAGTGRLTLAPAGTTLTTLLQVDAGDAQVNTVTGPVQVSAGGTVSGNGTTGPITLPSTTGVGTVSPGNGWGPDVSGILTANGDVSFGPTSTLYLNIIGDGSSNAGTQQPGTHYDQLFVNGKVNIAPGATLSGLVDTATVRLSNRFIVVRATDTITGTFAELPSSPGFVFIDGYKFDITYTVDPSTGHNLVVLDKVKVNTTTTLSSLNAYSALNGSPSTIEQPVTFKAVVTAEPGSRVPPPNTTFIEFFEDTGAGRVSLGRVPIAVGGIAELTTRDLSAGTHTITADYIVDGDLILDNDDFNQSTSNPVTQIVEQPAVSIALASPVPAPISPANPSPASVGVNDTLQLTAAVTSERSSYTPTFTVSTPGGTVVYRQVLPTVARVQPLNTSSFTATWDGTYNVGPNAGLFVPDGDYRAVITISDEWDRTPLTPTATTAPVTVRVDNTNPTTSGAVDALVINPGNATAPPPAQTAFSGTIVDDNVGTWTVTVTDSTGATVKVFPGSGPTVNVIWDGTDTGGATVADGRYTLTLVTTDAGGNTNFGTPVVRTVYVLRTAPVVTLSTGLGAATGPTTYGEAVTVRARVDLPAFVQAADKNTLLSGKTVTFDFPGTGTLTTTLPVNPAGGVFVASAVVPLNLAAGTYSPIVATFPATAELPVSTASGSHTVNRAALRVTGGNASREYGEPNPAFTYTVNTADLKFADTAAVVSGSPGTPATPASPVGSYAVNQGQGPGAVTALPNYDVVFTNGTLTVTPAAATIRVNDATRVRFAQNPPFTAVVDGLKLGDTAAVLGTLNLVTTAQTNSPIGTYTITLGSAPANANYTYAVVPGTLTVTGSANVTVVGSGEDSPPQVQVLSPAGEKLQNIAYGPTFNGGIRVASADFNKDGVADYVIGSGPGRVAFVQVIDGATGDTLFQAFPFESAFVGGVFVAAGDMTGDGVAELVVTPDEGGGPRVVIYNGGNNFSSLVSYFAIDDPAFRGGVRPAVGDIDGDGFADLVVSAGFGGGPRISVWNGEKLGKLEFVNMINDFFAFEDTLRNGAFVSVGDANGDGIGDLFVGAGPGGGPRVKLYDGRSLLSVGGDRATVVANFFAGNEANRGGVKVAAKNLDGDKFIDLVTGGGKGDRAVATAYRGSSLVTNNPVALYEFDLDGTLNGVFVG